MTLVKIVRAIMRCGIRIEPETVIEVPLTDALELIYQKKAEPYAPPPPPIEPEAAAPASIAPKGKKHSAAKAI